MRRTVILMGLIVLLAVGAAAQEVRVIELQHREAAEILPVLREVLGAGGTASAFEGKLILRGESAALGVAEEIVQRLDVPRPLLRISVRQEASRVGIEREGGSDAGTARRLGNTERTAEQFLSVMEGDTAVIVVGREVPVTHDVLVMTGRQTAVAREVSYRQVTTGFRVRPELRGEEVLVDIVPHMVFLSPRDPDIVDFHELATTVRIPLGQWYNLAGHLGRSSDLGRAILTLRAGGAEPDRAVWIRVERPDL